MIPMCTIMGPCTVSMFKKIVLPTILHLRLNQIESILPQKLDCAIFYKLDINKLERSVMVMCPVEKDDGTLRAMLAKG